MKQTIIADRVFDGDELHTGLPITFEDGHILAFDTMQGAKESRLSSLVTPGFIDVQVNGGGGVLFNSFPNVKGIAAIGKAHAKYGTTAFLPTLITDDLNVMHQAADAVAAALEQKVAGVVGVHFEGPHLSVPKKGVHPQPFIRRISDAELEIFSRQDLGIKVVTLAPENVSTEVIEALVKSGVKVCLGHSNADYDTVKAALDAGANGFTHLYNAMSALDSRKPGMVGAALESTEAWCGLIVDGHHVHPASARVAINAKPKGKVMLVTDAMPPVGTDDMEFDFFDGRKVIRTGDRLNSTTGELAGSVLDMASAVRNTVNWLDVPLSESLRMASLYPAEYLSLKTKGHLRDGADADFVELDDQIYTQATFIAGKQI